MDSHSSIIEERKTAKLWVKTNLRGASRRAIYDKALELGKKSYLTGLKCGLTHVATICECNLDFKRLPCICKNFDAAAGKPPPELFNEAMRKCKCHAGQKYQKCNDKLHLKALDYLVVVWLQEKNLVNARRDALWLLDLAPRQLEGYLRYAQVLRKTKHNALALGVYRSAIKVAKQNDHTSGSKYQSLIQLEATLSNVLSRLDPLNLPNELLLMIIKQLSVDDIGSLMKVSKQWYEWTTNNQLIWQCVILKPIAFQNKVGPYRCISKYSNHNIRRLAFGTPVKFVKHTTEFIASKAHALTHLHVECLHDDPIPPSDSDATLNQEFSLQHLSIMTYKISRALRHNNGHKLLHTMFRSSRATLRNIMFTAIDPGYIANPFELVNLEGAVLSRVVERDHLVPLPGEFQPYPTSNYVPEYYLHLFTSTDLTPRLKHVWYRPSSLANRRVCGKLSLETFILDVIQAQGHNYRDVIMMLGPSLDSLKIFHQHYFEWPNTPFATAHSMLGFLTKVYERDPQYAGLLAKLPEVPFSQIESIGPISLGLLQKTESPVVRGLSIAMEAGRVRHVSLVIPTTPGSTPMLEFRNTAFWGLSSLTSLTLIMAEDIQFRVGSLDQRHCDKTIQDFLQSFTNLKCVLIRDQWASVRPPNHTAGLIADVLRTEHPTLKVVYNRSVNGKMRDDLRKVAKAWKKEIAYPIPLAGQPGEKVTERTLMGTFDIGFPARVWDDYPTVNF